MAVYVDEPIWPFGRMKMCHMLADTITELHTMADVIGVARRHYQGPPKTRTPHYDICKSKRQVAVKAGALECDRHTMVQVMRRVRTQHGEK